MTERIASRGIAWGQVARGKDLLFVTGPDGSDEPISNNPNEEEGLRLLHLAADQGESLALNLLSEIHEEGLFGQEQSQSLAFEYLKQAADKGCLISQIELAAKPHETMTRGDQVYYATLACSDMHKERSYSFDLNKLHAAYILGVAFYYGKHYDELGFSSSSPERNLYLVGSTSDQIHAHP